MESSSRFSAIRNILFLVCLLLVLLALVVSRMELLDAPVGDSVAQPADNLQTREMLEIQAALDADDYARATTLLLPQAEAGVAQARFELAQLYEKGRGFDRDFQQAFHWYQLAAVSGHAESQYALARMYAYGYGVEQDTAQAALWSQRAVDNGFGQQEAAKASE